MNEIQNLRIKDIAIFIDHMSVYIVKRKNDLFRDGHISLLARSGKVTCPVSITEKMLQLLTSSNPEFPVIRRIVKSRSREYFHSSKGISYSTIREEFKKHIRPFVDDISCLSTHSIKAGAASNSGCRKISGDLLDKHAGWKCAASIREDI